MTVKRSFWGVFLFYNHYKHYENENKCKIILYINFFALDLLYQITIKTYKEMEKMLEKVINVYNNVKLIEGIESTVYCGKEFDLTKGSFVYVKANLGVEGVYFKFKDKKQINRDCSVWVKDTNEFAKILELK